MKKSVDLCDVQASFGDTMSGVQYLHIIQMFFFPFTKTREAFQFEKDRFVPKFTGQGVLNLGPVADGIASGSNSAIVVCMEENDSHYVTSPFCRRFYLKRPRTQ